MRGPHPTPELHQRLAKASEKESIPVAISYRAAELDVLGPGAPSEIIAATIAETSEPIVAWLARRGFVETGRARYAPVVFGNLSAGAIEQIAHDERLAAVSADDAREALELAAQDPVKKHNIDSVWNSAGNYAEKQPVGLIEACQAETFGPYTLFDDHEAFAFNASKPIYEVSPPMNQCNSSADCAGSRKAAATAGSRRRASCAMYCAAP